MRIYIDTSVVGGYYDKEFDIATIKLFEKVKKGEITLVVSDPMEAELLGAPALVKNHLEEYAKNIEKAALTREAAALADHYIREKVVGRTSVADCQHIAIATLCKVDVLVSWNFKHIVNLTRIRGYNSVNLKLGYTMLEIRTPEEII
jgi:predicted nucleic acid-binding protein